MVDHAIKPTLGFHLSVIFVPPIMISVEFENRSFIALFKTLSNSMLRNVIGDVDDEMHRL